MTRTPRLPPLVVETRDIEPVDDLLSLADPHNPLAWLRRGNGIVGSGRPVVQIGAAGSPPLSRPIAEIWREIAADDYFQGMFTTALEEGEIVTYDPSPPDLEDGN